MGTIRSLPQRPLLSWICHACHDRAPDGTGRCLPITLILGHTEGCLHSSRVNPETWEKQKTHKACRKLFLTQCFSQAEMSWGWEKRGGKRGEHCPSRAWTQNLPWKGNFPPRQGSSPESQAVLLWPESPGRPGEGPAHTLGQSELAGT